MGNLLQKHPLASYYVIAFGISWGTVIYGAGGLEGFPAPTEQREANLPWVVLATVGGPSTAGPLAQLALRGNVGSRRGRLARWEHWHLAVGLFAPIAVASTLGLLCWLASPELCKPAIATAENKTELLLSGAGYGVIAGLLEELGWTGFAVPETRKHDGVVTTGVKVGIAWGLWHFLVAVWGSGGPDGSFVLDLFAPWIPWNLLVLPCHRVLMVMMCERTEESSILAAAIMHGTLTASLPLILQPPATGTALCFFHVVFAIVLASLAAVLALVSGKRSDRGVKVDWGKTN
jgi:hypothetical protein